MAKNSVAPAALPTMPPGESEFQHSVRRTATQRRLLRALLDGPKEPETLSERRAYEALAQKRLAVELEDGSFMATDFGRQLSDAKVGAPSKFTGVWLELSKYYGGTEKLASLVPISPSVLNRWALHGGKPSGAGRRRVQDLAEQAGLPDPWSAA